MDDSRRCNARHSDGSGKRCKKAAMMGQRVCRAHGGASPQAMRSARERLNALVEPAIEALAKALKSGDVNAIIRASVVVLDRCGFHPRQAVELTGQDGQPIQTEDAGQWIEFCTLEEKRAVLEIAERAMQRMENARPPEGG